jgi:hypothetical protein
MNCDQLRDHYDLFALDIAEQPERSEIRDHLNRGCEVCTAGVRRSVETATLIGATAPPAQPSSQLRRRILASVRRDEQPSRWMVWAAVLAMTGLVVVAVYFAATSQEYAQEAARLRDQVRVQSGQIGRLTEAFAILAGLFQSQDDGNAMHDQPGMVDVSSTAAIAVTVENQAGADQPTTQPLIVAPLAAALR